MIRLPVAILTVLAIAFSLATGAEAQQSLKATTSKAARQEALQAIPLEKLPSQDARRVATVVNDASIFRRLPTEVIESDPNLFLFLARHPELIVGIWDEMGISNIALKRTGESTFQAGDNKGTLCTIEQIHSSPNLQIYFAQGQYDGPLFQGPVNADCVIVMHSGYVREPSGKLLVTARIDAFIQINRLGVELLARTIQPLIGKAADFNFVETMKFVSSISEASEKNPAGVKRMTDKLDDVDPQVKDQFIALTEKIAQRAEESPTVKRVQLEQRPTPTKSNWRR